MSDVRLVVIYPRPKDTDVFKRAYTDQHVPLAVEKLDGKSKIVATKIAGSAQALPLMQALEACAASEGGKGTCSQTANA
jgi:hypothetical protein